MSKKTGQGRGALPPPEAPALGSAGCSARTTGMQYPPTQDPCAGTLLGGLGVSCHFAGKEAKERAKAWLRIIGLIRVRGGTRAHLG